MARQLKNLKPWKNISDLPNIVPVNIHDDKSGPWEVFSYEVSKDAAEWGRLRSMIGSSDRGRYVPEGSYKGLKDNGHMIMSNTPDEIRDIYPFLRIANGNVLINGLGLGIALDLILKKRNEDNTPAVTKVIVIEVSMDVINLVAPSFTDKRVTIINADALTYKPKDNYDAVWHDIWPDISSDNIKTMKTLHRKYGRKSTWQGSWCRERCEYFARRDKQYY
jgi:hypothetical protein